MKRVGPVLIVLVVVTAALAVHVYRSFNNWIGTPLPVEEPVVVVVETGSTLRQTAESLEQAGVLDRPQHFVWYARLRDKANDIKAGEYKIEVGTTPAELLEMLISGAVVLHQITFIEGWTFAQIREALAAHDKVSNETAGLDDAEVMEALALDGLHPEGRFFPDTYRFAAGTSDLEVLDDAQTLMSEHLATVWEGRASGLPFSTSDEALILASIIEKETGLDTERAQISGVFVRRLTRGMRLQSDPTVIYGLGDAYDGDIRSRDLQTDTPYNTYTRDGLPPTPIAMPGLGALQAAAQPADGKALYFVATGDPDRSHYFSETLTEHNDAVARYLKKLRSNQ